MVDKTKRNVLKTFAVLAGSGFTGGASAAAASSAVGSDASFADAPLADLQVSTRVSPTNNDIEVVIRNIGTEPTTITSMTPDVTVTHRGQFNFASLFKQGNPGLRPGQELRVPLEPKKVTISAARFAGESRQQQTQSLLDSLRKSVSIVTDDAYAKVTID